jgi:formylglycine-generating enzyme required for sulfatase activity
MVLLPAGRLKREGVTLEIRSFAIGRHEVTWSELEAFVYDAEPETDADSLPSFPYEPPDRGMGRGDHAAMSIQWGTARAYCAWLSKKTGRKFRLPTEAEWEYACRAGSDRVSLERLGDYAWHKGSSDTEKKGEPKNQRVGQKKPNAFGLHDMLGGAAEWCQEPYAADLWAPREAEHECLYNKVCPHVIRGGSYRDAPSELRAAVRDFPRQEWNKRDPQRPRGKSWLTDAPWVGFRVVRDVEPGEK